MCLEYDTTKLTLFAQYSNYLSNKYWSYNVLGVKIEELFVTLPLQTEPRTELLYRGIKNLTMTPDERLKIEEQAVEMLRTVYDPEIPVDIYSLGLVYKIDLDDDGTLNVDMTLTAPNCPMADFIFEDVRTKLESIDGVTAVNVNIVYEPEWTQDMMSEEAKLELGLL